MRLYWMVVVFALFAGVFVTQELQSQTFNQIESDPKLLNKVIDGVRQDIERRIGDRNITILRMFDEERTAQKAPESYGKAYELLGRLQDSIGPIRELIQVYLNLLNKAGRTDAIQKRMILSNGDLEQFMRKYDLVK